MNWMNESEPLMHARSGSGRVRVIYKFSDHDIHIQFEGSLESHGGAICHEIFQVFPKTKTITVYE